MDYNLEEIRKIENEAMNGNAQALSELAQCYYFGTQTNIQIDYKKAFELFSKAAELNNVYSQLMLAYMYENGVGGEQDFDEAVKWYDMAAKNGNADAMVNLGNCYFYGRGVKQDYVAANSLYLKAANAGNVMGMNAIATSYYFGYGMEINSSIAIEWFKRASDLGYMFSEYALANISWDNENYEDAAIRYKKVLEGDEMSLKRNAQYMLAKCYYLGRGVVRNYYIAVDLFTELASEDAEAAYYLGECYRLGKGVDANDYEAFKNYLFCAEYGNGLCNILSQFQVGVSYAFGNGTVKDFYKAVYWWKKAAEQGDADSQYNLAIAYFNGDGVEVNKKLAMYWCNEAAKQGYEGASDKLMMWSRYF